MKLKIISDGNRYGTRVVDAETGEPIERVVAVNWFCDANDFDGYSRCEIIVEGVQVDAEVETGRPIERRVIR